MHFVSRVRKLGAVAELDDADGAGRVVNVEDEQAMINDQHAQFVIAERVFWREGQRRGMNRSVSTRARAFSHHRAAVSGIC